MSLEMVTTVTLHSHRQTVRQLPHGDTELSAPFLISSYMSTSETAASDHKEGSGSHDCRHCHKVTCRTRETPVQALEETLSPAGCFLLMQY